MHNYQKVRKSEIHFKNVINFPPFFTGADVTLFQPMLDQISNSLNNGRGRGNPASGPSGPGVPDQEPQRDQVSNKYCCSRCGRSYQHQATLVRHQRYECGIQASYPCDICNRKFKRRDVLKGHKEKCVSKVQAQAALASMASNVASSVSGSTTPNRAVSPPSMTVSPATTLASVAAAAAAAAAAGAGEAAGFRSELHHTF